MDLSISQLGAQRIKKCLRHANPQDRLLPAQSVFKNLATRVNCKLSSGSCRGEFVVQLSRCHPRLPKPVLHSAPNCRHCWVLWLLILPTAVGFGCLGSVCRREHDPTDSAAHKYKVISVDYTSLLVRPNVECIRGTHAIAFTSTFYALLRPCACRRAVNSTSTCMCWLSLLEDLSSCHHALRTSSRTVVPMAFTLDNRPPHEPATSYR